MTMRTCALLLLAALACTVSYAIPDPAQDFLFVYAAGGGRASVFVAPQSAIGGLGEEVSQEAFSPRYLKGTTPLQITLKPGTYVVSVLATGQYTLRDAMAKVHDYIWTGFDGHALVSVGDAGQWRYAHCYLVDKQAGEGTTVFAVFTGWTSPGAVQSFAPASGPGTRFLGREQEGLKQLLDGGLPTALADDVLGALLTGHKVVCTSGDTRYVVGVVRPNTLRVQQGRANANWSGHRLSICSGE